ncbi:TPA: conjugal transfer protein TraH [Staphylococcus aureus]|nr:conjugal transfer protein TraH [Staphylococcus aureus]
MKKLLTIVILFTLVLAGCGQNQSEKNSEKHNEEKTVDTTKERNDMIKGLIEYGYENDDYKGYKHMKDILSEKLQKQAELQNQSAQTKGVKKETKDIKLYQDVDNDDELIYSIKLSITNKKEKNSDYSMRYGKIELTEEEGKQKIDNVEELTQRNLVSMNQE